MTDQLPERIVAWPHGHWETLAGECLVTGNGGVFLRADTAIPRAEADAMVAAAFEQAQHTAQIAWNWPESEASSAPVCEAIAKLTPADARAAFERAVREAAEAAYIEGGKAAREDQTEFVQEAVEAERAKWQSAITLIERVYYMEGKDAKWRAAHMNGIARDVQNGLDLAWAKRMFPRDSEALSEARKVHSEEAAAIRAPQEASE